MCKTVTMYTYCLYIGGTTKVIELVYVYGVMCTKCQTDKVEASSSSTPTKLAIRLLLTNYKEDLSKLRCYSSG